MSRRRVLHCVFRLLLAKLGPRTIASIIWRKRRPKYCSSRCVEGFGTIYVSPLFLLSKGLISDQIVQVSISYHNHQGSLKHCERLFRVRALYRLLADEFSLGSDDVFNLFGRDTAKEAQIDAIRPIGPRPSSDVSLSVVDDVRISPIRQPSTKDDDPFDEQLKHFLATPRIIYQHDVFTLVIPDDFGDHPRRRCFRLDCPDSPSILNSSSSVYETAPLSSHLPHAGRRLPHAFPLPRPLFTVLERMTDLCLAHESISDEPLVLLLHGAAGSGKRLLVSRLAASTHQNLIEMSCYDLWSEVAAQAETKLKNAVEKARSYQPCILYLTSLDVLGYDPNASEIDHRVLSTLRSLIEHPAQMTIIFSCRNDQLSNISASLHSLCLYTLSLEHLNEQDRMEYFEQRYPKEVAHFAARHTSGFSLAELFHVVYDCKYHKKTVTTSDTADSKASLEWAIDKRNASFADAIGAPKIPNVSWDDVGGLEETKQLVIESIEANLHGSRQLKRSGIILFGPPGCGKTLIAKAVATEFKIAFLSVKGPELLNKYVGQSEENLRKVFERAQQASPCVIFFDELDSLAPNRGKSGDSGGVMDRIVSSLLSELDALHNMPSCKVFVMAATNRADLLDPSLLTPGRFDKVVNVSPGSSVESKAAILRAVSRSVNLHESVDMIQIASKCPEVISGAELYSVVSTATMEALREQVRLIESGLVPSTSTPSLTVTPRHLEAAIQSTLHRTEMR